MTYILMVSASYINFIRYISFINYINYIDNYTWDRDFFYSIISADNVNRAKIF